MNLFVLAAILNLKYVPSLKVSGMGLLDPNMIDSPEY